MSDQNEPIKFTPQMIQQFEHGSTVIIDYFPPLWYGIYKKCVEEGFSEQQAMQCVCAYIQRP